MLQALINISGKVQGVGFRYSAIHAAKQSGLGGYVKNMADGSVEALVQGDKESIDQFIGWCKEGPSVSKVDHVKITWQNAKDIHENFEIL